MRMETFGAMKETYKKKKEKKRNNKHEPLKIKALFKHLK